MKREIIGLTNKVRWTCCAGHDPYPSDKYKNKRSCKARARMIKREHRHARSVMKRELLKELNN